MIAARRRILGAGDAAAGLGTLNWSLTDTSTEAGASTITSTAMSIGAADSSRVIVAIVHAHSNSPKTCTNLTIGGSVDTLVTHANARDGVTAMAIRAIATGTTADVVATFSGAMADARFQVLRLVVDGSGTIYTEEITAASPVSSSLAVTLDLDIPAGGVGFYASTQRQSSPTASSGWAFTNATEIDSNINSFGFKQSDCLCYNDSEGNQEVIMDRQDGGLDGSDAIGNAAASFGVTA